MKGLDPKAFHHTYIISGDRQSLSVELISFLEKEMNLKTKGNPDFLFKKYDTFLVDDARDINLFQQNKTLDSHQILILSVSQMTPQAQNAFLKIAEDPAEKTTFFFLVPSLEIIIPTLRSRAEVIENNVDVKDVQELAKKFLASNPKDRMDIVADLHPKDKELVNLEKIESFLGALEVILEEKVFLHDLYEVKRKIRFKGVSIKVLLEHLAGVLPF